MGLNEVNGIGIALYMISLHCVAVSGVADLELIRSQSQRSRIDTRYEWYDMSRRPL